MSVYPPQDPSNDGIFVVFLRDGLPVSRHMVSSVICCYSPGGYTVQALAVAS